MVSTGSSLSGLSPKNGVAFQATDTIFSGVVVDIFDGSTATIAEVVKLVDALRSGRSSRKGVGVRIPPSALFLI